MIWFFLYAICGLGAMILSIVAWRTKKDIYFLLGVVATAIVLMVDIYFYDVFRYLLATGAILYMLIVLSFVVVPIIFLVMAKTQKADTGLDGASGGGAVTDDYLNKIINEQEDDIDFDSEYDLK